MIRRIIQRYRENYGLLRRAADALGREFEGRPYAELEKPAEELSGVTEFEGARIYYSAEAHNVAADGDLHFCIDVSSPDLSTLFGIRPSYQFKKRRDGTIYY